MPGRGHGWTWKAKLHFGHLESAPSREKQPPQVHSITARLCALSAVTGTRMSGRKGRTHGRQNQRTLLPPEETPVTGGSGEPDPDAALVGDAETDGHPQQDISSEDLKTS